MKLVVLGALSLLSAYASAASLEWAGDFEEGASSIDGSADADFAKKLYDEGKAAAADVQTLGGMSICNVPRAGKYSGRNRILTGGKGIKVRSEIKAHLPGVYNFQWDGPEYWMGFSMCLAQWPNGSDVHTFLQVHAPNEPSGSNCDFAGNAITIGASNDTGTVHVINNPSGISSGKGAFANSKVVYNFNLRSTMGQWQDFVFQFRFSTKGTGYYSVWHNGKRVAMGAGITNVNWRDSCGKPIEKTYHNGPHIGMYGGPNNAGPKAVYLDAVSVAVGPDGYALVAPQ